VRELENEIERAVALTPKGSEITPACLSERVWTPLGAAPPGAAPTGPLRAARASFERSYVAAVLERQGGNATRAAGILGISRQMMQRKIREYGLRDA
jgi:two-component system nitrogen regulation response regulator NtrX